MCHRSWSALAFTYMLAVAACGGSVSGSTADGGPSLDAGTADAPGNDGGDAGDSGGRGGQDGSAASDANAASDAGDANDGSDAPTFSVANLPGLALWLEAGVGITQSAGSVTRWNDQSLNANDATATSGSTPTFVASDIAGRPGVRFQGGNHLTIADSPTSSLRFGTGDFLVEAVVYWTGTPSSDLTTGYGLIYSKQDANAPYYGVGMFADYPSPSPNTTLGVQTSIDDHVVSNTTGLNDGKARLVGIVRTGLTVDLRIDGAIDAAQTFAQTDDCDAPGRPAFIGSQAQAQGNVQQLDGDIAEIVAVKGTISPEELKSLEAYLMAKYNL